MNPGIFASLLLLQVALAAPSPEEGLRLPEEIHGVSLGMSGRELVATKPALKNFSVGVDDPDESPRDIDFGTRREAMLFEELKSTVSFAEAMYYIVGGSVTAIFLNPDTDWSGTDLLVRRPRAIMESVRRWGRPTCRVVERDLLHGKRAPVPILVWRQDGTVITLSVPTDDIPESMAAVVYGMEIRQASNGLRPGDLSSAPEAKVSKKVRRRICASLGIDYQESK